ncbi:MAG: hypothetical protein NW217_16345 [Hyphomicrobiaceae bacterium]|nr:hypothetical protein [Hyphomicrobiaceae bacterium]
MQNFGLRDALDRLGLKQADFARLIEVSPRTVSLWATGESALPGPVAAYLRVLVLLPTERLAGELARIKGRKKMFDEGLYSLSYGAQGLEDRDSALAVLRNGKILGSDRLGGVFSGSYEFDESAEVNRMHVRLQVPPCGTLVTGYAVGPQGAVIDIVGAFERAAPVARTTVDVLGAPVDVQLTYLGALPV